MAVIPPQPAAAGFVVRGSLGHLLLALCKKLGSLDVRSSSTFSYYFSTSVCGR
ncbi:hypothetical protein RchiOBHm_Chr7g0205751 [Rosa chinensis]|uniref:Uncharacterized protein n=1 Tax=Rosa chinensis TaxID=74649 RepID=A0A2P6P920_ROSCH|nr:hypothetical protein RchiOBHm_Chr7g0205751 [Rosa chinensis]